MDDYDDTPYEITIFPAGDDSGWEIVVTDKNGNEEGDAVFCDTKAEAIKDGRCRFNTEPTVKRLVALNKEHWEITESDRLILVNDKRIIRHRITP